MQREDFDDVKEVEEGGAYGKLFKARQPKLDRDVALKMIDSSIEGAPDALAHARAMAKVEHENIVKIFSFEQFDLLQTGQENDVIVMQWLPGETLEEHLSGERFSEEDALAICNGVLSGMIALHEGNVAHGDLHCRNIMLVGGNHPVIIDVHPVDQAFLSQQSLSTREAKVSQDIGFCRTVIIRTLRHSMVSAVTTANFDTRLVQAATLEELKKVVNDFENSKSAIVPNASSPPEALYKECMQLIENGKIASLQMKLTNTTQEVCTELTSSKFAVNTKWENEIAKERIEAYVGLVSELATTLSACCMFGNEREARLVGECIQSTANVYEDVARPSRSVVGFSKLKYFPAIFLLYSALLGASLSKNYRNLFILLNEFHLKIFERSNPLVEKLLEAKADLVDVWNQLYDEQKRYKPVSDDLGPRLYPLLNSLTPKTQADFIDDFDRMEYFVGLVLSFEKKTPAYIGAGSFLWRHAKLSRSIDFSDELASESKAFSDGESDWPAFKAGFFEGNKTFLINALGEFEKQVEAERNRLRIR